MSKLQKNITLTLSTLVVFGLLLGSAVVTLAADGFTLIGTYTVKNSTTWTVTGVDFDVSDATCTTISGTSGSCSPTNPLPVDALVEVKGDVAGKADTVAELAKFKGDLKSISGDNEWIFDDTHKYLVDEGIPQPDFVAPGDTVEVTYKFGDPVMVAVEIKLVSRNPKSVYTYKGEVAHVPDDTDPQLQVDNYYFTITEGTILPAYYGKGDIVTVLFTINGSEYTAVEVVVETTYIPPKTESLRCDDRVGSHPGVQKVADDVGASYEAIFALFCKGFGLGEIKLAYKWGQGSMYTPEMLLALRAQGYGWGELKKMAANNPDIVDDNEGDGERNGGKGHDKNETGKPEKTGKPDKPGKQESPGNSDHSNTDNNGKAKGKNK